MLSGSAAKAVDQYRDVDALMRADLEHYCATLVKIKDKTGKLVSFAWNREQRYVHGLLERQKELTGRVRAVILKARQRGISTYIGARFYHSTTMNLGISTYILTHEDKATKNLFGMVKRMHDNMAIDYRPRDTAKNANELLFGDLDGGYGVGTARNVHGSGRALTIQLFHGSEVGYWPEAQAHMSGVMQAIGDMRGTEVVLESTANGIGNAFYEIAKQAEQGLSDFILIFIPWYWAEDYRRAVPDGFVQSDEEAEYAALYELTPEQVCWMHFKNVELGGKPGHIGWMFRQEYPANAHEAFQTSGSDTFIRSEVVMRARRFNAPEQTHAPVVLGVDVARGGDDRTRIIGRQGRKLGVDGLPNEIMHVRDLMVIADRVALLLRDHPVIRMAFIDITGIGAGVYDRLCQLGYQERVQGINFGQDSSQPDRFLNKRAEMWWELRDWLSDQGGVQIPDDDTAHAHLCAPEVGPGASRFDANSRFILESKDRMKDRLKFSPDFGDAAALTFAAPIYEPKSDARPAWMRQASKKPRRGFMAR